MHFDDRLSWFLIFAHPGHELRAHHFMERTRPIVAVLTDGSGSTGRSRLDETRCLLAEVNAYPAPTFGPLTDLEVYAALMAADAGPFLAQLDRLVGDLVTTGVQAAIVDAAEGFNPTHDVCHWLGYAATARARQLGAEIELFELDLISHPDGEGAGVRLALDDEAFTRKLAAISRYDALREEAAAAFERHGQEAFRVEFLRRVVDRPVPPSSWIPYYEEVGEARVKAGRYTSVLRYASHVRPVIEALLGSPLPTVHASPVRTVHE